MTSNLEIPDSDNDAGLGLEQILETIRSGGNEMNDYRAIHVTRLPVLPDGCQFESPRFILHRKGNLFRCDQGFSHCGISFES